jgi:hypothetical protein
MGALIRPRKLAVLTPKLAACRTDFFGFAVRADYCCFMRLVDARLGSDSRWADAITEAAEFCVFGGPQAGYGRRFASHSGGHEAPLATRLFQAAH